MAQLAFLGDGWWAAVADLGPVPAESWSGPETGVRLDIAGGPDGDIRVDVVLQGAEPLRVGAGGSGRAADVVLTLGWADAVAIARGSLRLDTAYMQGRAKLAGDHRLVLALLAATETPGWRQARDRLAALTDFGA